MSERVSLPDLTLNLKEKVNTCRAQVEGWRRKYYWGIPPHNRRGIQKLLLLSCELSYITVGILLLTSIFWDTSRSDGRCW